MLNKLINYRVNKNKCEHNYTKEIIMKNNVKSIKSSQKLSEFLEKNSLHKKDFAEMIGVTLSYVYNLIDETIPFSTRSTTLERIATVMDIKPEEFEEYKIPQEPRLYDESVQLIKSIMKENDINTITFLKGFPRKKRVDIVDILRGAQPIPLDYKELDMIGKILNLDKSDIFNLWETRFKQILEINGMNLSANSQLVSTMIECARKYAQKY